jgi:short-subunit dehydrogenase involved in D-alanine esterification of teichoic acids
MRHYRHGGGRGIGRAIAEGLPAVGAAVAVTGRSRQSLDDAVAAIEANGGHALAVQ